MKTLPKILLEREGYRFVEKGIIELNGKPDYRLQKQNYYTKYWNDIYLFDNGLQCSTAMEDIEYAKWLDPDTVPCYVKGEEEYWDDSLGIDSKLCPGREPPQSHGETLKVLVESSMTLFNSFLLP